MLHFNRLCAVVLACAALLLGLGSAQAQPKRLPQAKATDCVACHGKQAVLHKKHDPVKGMSWAKCLSCHEKVDPESTLAGRLSMSHSHALAGKTCASCHGKAKGKPKPVEMDKCLSCHEIDKLVAKTAGVKPHNPHTSPHYGTDMECSLCHVAHGKSQNYCNECHEYGFRVP